MYCLDCFLEFSHYQVPPPSHPQDHVFPQERAVLHDIETIVRVPRPHYTPLPVFALPTDNYRVSSGSIVELNLNSHGMQSVLLHELPESIGNLTQFRKLAAPYMHLVSLPESIGSLQHLEELSLHFNRDLRTLPESIGNLTQLRILNLDSTGLVSLPGSYIQYTSTFLPAWPLFGVLQTIRSQTIASGLLETGGFFRTRPQTVVATD